MKQTRKTISFAAVFAGLVFLAGPVFRLYDLIPDVFGGLLCALGLARAADADERFEDARRSALAVALVSFLRLALAFTVAGNAEDALPFVFMANVVELIVYLPFFHRLFAGFSYSASRLDKPVIAKKADGAYLAAVVFIVAKAVLTFVPETLYLFRQKEEIDLSANAAYRVSVMQLYPYVATLCLTVVFLLGVIFLVYAAGLFRAVSKDKEYRAALYEKADEMRALTRREHVCAALAASHLFVACGTLCLSSFLIDGVDVLPNILGAFCFALAFPALARFGVKTPKLPVAALLAAGAASTALGAFFARPLSHLVAGETAAAAKYPAYDLLENGSAALLTAIVGAVSAVLFVLVLRRLAKEKDALWARETGDKDGFSGGPFVAAILAAVLAVSGDVCRLVSAKVASSPDVAAFIDRRRYMTPNDLRETLNSLPAARTFDTLENAAFYLSALSLVIAAVGALWLVSERAKIKGEAA